MISQATDRFWESFSLLPARVQKQAEKAYEQWQTDSKSLKKLSLLLENYSSGTYMIWTLAISQKLMAYRISLQTNELNKINDLQ